MEGESSPSPTSASAPSLQPFHADSGAFGFNIFTYAGAKMKDGLLMSPLAEDE